MRRVRLTPIALALALWAGRAAAADPPGDTPLLADFKAVCVQSLADPTIADADLQRLGAQLDENIHRPGRVLVVQRWEHAVAGRTVTIDIAQDPLEGDPTRRNTGCSVADSKDAGASLPGLQAWLGAPLVPAHGDDFALTILHPSRVAPSGAVSLNVSTFGDQTMIVLMRRGPTQAIAAAPLPFTQAPARGCEPAKLRPDPAEGQAAYIARLKRCLPPGTAEPMVTLTLTGAGFRIAPGSRTAVFEGPPTRMRPAAPPQHCHRCDAAEQTLDVKVRWTVDPADALLTSDVEWSLAMDVVVT